MSVELSSEELMAALDEQFEVLAPEIERAEGEPFALRTELQADWALRRLQRIELRLGEIHATAVAERAVIDAWEAGESERLQADHDHFEGLLKAFMASTVDRDPKLRTVRLPHGELKARSTPDQWVFDTDAFVGWATKARLKELLRITVEPDRVAVKRTVQVLDGRAFLEGERVEGVSIEPGQLRFYVTAGASPSPSEQETLDAPLISSSD